jgi:hypothetical protein
MLLHVPPQLPGGESFADRIRRRPCPVVIAENQELHHELDRLRGLLRRHGIEPNDGTARTA